MFDFWMWGEQNTRALGFAERLGFYFRQGLRIACHKAESAPSKTNDTRVHNGQSAKKLGSATKTGRLTARPAPKSA